MVAIDRQGICDADLSNRLLHRPCFDDRIVAIHVRNEHHPLVLLLFRNPQYGFGASSTPQLSCSSSRRRLSSASVNFGIGIDTRVAFLSGFLLAFSISILSNIWLTQL
uniref:Uncharacterized protein n=1 Tax=Fagus sylvatica TaxID=28930 RepID=A0A2N9GU71_FAGSY